MEPMTLRICHLYPTLLSIAGDGGNLMAISGLVSSATGSSTAPSEPPFPSARSERSTSRLGLESSTGNTRNSTNGTSARVTYMAVAPGTGHRPLALNTTPRRHKRPAFRRWKELSANTTRWHMMMRTASRCRLQGKLAVMRLGPWRRGASHLGCQSIQTFA